MAKVLLTHDGELADVRQMLAELCADVTVRTGKATTEDHTARWNVVIGTPRRVLDLQVGAEGVKPVRIALLQGDSRTLLRMLRRSGVDLIVRRPVHASALRLLLLHALYQGPEKRKHPRITIGAPVRYRAGLFSKDATLADLSLRGCRLLSRKKARRDASIKLTLGPELGCDKGVTVGGRVIRCGPTEVGGEAINAIAVQFTGLDIGDLSAIKAVLDEHVRGPAILDDLQGKDQSQSRRVDSSDTAAPSAMADDSTGEDGAPCGEGDRRDTPRRAIDRHIIALGVEATRVLIGRDISLGGMRVEPNDTIGIGDHLQVALHVRARSEPLVVNACVERDDGDDGMLLRFEDLSDVAQNYLRKMVHLLPILAARGDDDEGQGLIVSEILERS